MTTPEDPTTPPAAEPPLSPRTPRQSDSLPGTQTFTDADLTALLSRLSARSTVASLLVLSRDTGSIIRSEGVVSARDDETGEKVKKWAGKIWGLVKAAEEGGTGGLFGVFDEEEGEGVKLMRVRTGRREVVVVPDKKYLLVVVHEIPGQG